MKILFYLNPESDLVKNNSLRQWAKWLILINDAIKINAINYESIFLGHISAKSYFSMSSQVFWGLSSDEVICLSKIRDNFRKNCSNECFKNDLKNLLQFSFKPDFIISIGDAKYLEFLFPDAGIIHVEMAPFYRLIGSGLIFCANFTDFPKVSDVLRTYYDGDKYPLNLEVINALRVIKKEIKNKYRDNALISRINEYKKKFNKVCVIPLAESYFSPLRIKVFDLISDFMNIANPNDLYILADHPLALALSDLQIFELKNNYSNLMIVRKDFEGLLTQNFYQICDVVYTDFSNASIDSIFFDGVEYKSLLAELDSNLMKYCNFRNPLSELLIKSSKNELDQILYLLLRYCCIPENKFFNGMWWSDLLLCWNKDSTIVEIENCIALRIHPSDSMLSL